MFPSLTAASHSALWTGAWGRTSGIAANWMHPLPRAGHTVSETVSGFGYAWQNAEPLWVAAARQGRSVVGHHVTQAPAPPGFPLAGGASGDRYRQARAALDRPGAFVVNGFNRRLGDARVITEQEAPVRDRGPWSGLDRLPAGGLPAREVAWSLDGRGGRDSLFGLVTGEGRYQVLWVASSRDLREAVRVDAAEAAPADADEPLAGRFAAAVRIPVDGGTAYVRLRLFFLALDATSFVLFQPAVDVVEGNTPDVAAAYDAAVGGTSGNTAAWAYLRGAFGPPQWEGGDGRAEARFLETVELVIAYATAGAEWAWRTRRPDLLLTYTAVGDDIDHALWADVAPDVPGVPPARARTARAVRSAVWSLIDRHVGALQALVDGTPGAALFVSGDHGMRAVWRTTRPNVVLAEAGLLALDTLGEVDVSRTLAVSPSGYWITVNTTDFAGGVVPPSRRAAIADSVVRVLSAVRDPEGRPVYTAFWRGWADDSLGLGGPAGGDVYFALAPGWHTRTDRRGAALSDDRTAGGAHGFPSTDADMATGFCALGDGIAPARLGRRALVDVAPTVAAWIGMRPPQDAVGKAIPLPVRP